MDAFRTGAAGTRGPYIAIEHQWMHPETLAYMLAQEQRMGWEGPRGEAPAGPGTPIKASPLTAAAELSSASSDDATPSHADGHAEAYRHSDGNVKEHVHGHANWHTSGNVNGHANGVHSSVSAPYSSSRSIPGHGDSDTQTHISPAFSTILDTRSNNKAFGSQSAFVQIPSGSVTLGTDMNPSQNFAWDNEGPQQQPHPVSGFLAASQPVTNAQYYAFAVTAGGYDRAEYWGAKDLAVKKKRGQNRPATWTLQVALTAGLSLAWGLHLPS